MKKVVLLGGGTGLSNLISAIKDFDYDMSVGVAISDNGGSTGKIREYYNIPAPGDLRKVMSAFIDEEEKRKLFEYRFDENLEEHTVGNLVLAALNDMEGDMSQAVEKYCEIFDIKHNVYPISNASVQLSAKIKGSKVIHGEHEITKNGSKIKEVFYEENIKGSYKIIEKIKEADYIIFSAGSLYTSLLPNLIIEDILEEIKKSKATKIYISNIMTQKGETDDYSVSDHLNAISKHTYNGIVDIVIANNYYHISEEILKKYKKVGSQLVKLDKDDLKNVILYSDKLIKEDDYIRHDVEKVSSILQEIMKG